MGPSYKIPIDMEFIPNEQLRFLVQIQEKDSRILEIAEKQKVLPDIIASLRVTLEREEVNLSEVVTDHDNASKERRDLEGRLKDAEEKVRKLKGRIPEIKTNKEYQALLKEIELAGQEKSDIEENILILMEKIDVLNAVRTDKERIVAEEEEKFKEEKEKIEKEFQQLSERLKEIESQKSVIVSQIDSKVISEYNRLISARRGLAVVLVKNEFCQGCHMRIPPQISTEIRKNDNIIHCLSCQRVLYWKPD